MKTNRTKHVVATAAVLAFAFLGSLPFAHATTYYVDSGIGTNLYDGLSATVTNGHGPKPTVASVLNLLAQDGDTIYVAEGVYYEPIWDVGTNSVTVVPQGNVMVDLMPPCLWAVFDPGTIVNGWITIPFDVYWNATDVGSGVAWITPTVSITTNGTQTISGSAGDYAGNVTTTNLTFNLDTTPPEITATVTPAPNEYGWNNTNVVVVSFSATDTVSGVSWYGPTYPVSVTGETNDCEVMAVAVDNAGNATTNYVYVNIDLTPPVLDLDPGQGQQFNNSHPLLIVDYSDPSGVGVPPASPSGVNLDTLQIMLNGEDVTTNFYRFSNRAILSTNLASGTYTWSATIADYASNTMTQTGTFTATGTTNAAAPVMSGLNVTDTITIMPDMPEMWVQGDISGTGSTVYASVNGGEAQPLNMRGGTFGYLLPLDYGTNVIVLAGSDSTGTNVGSQVLLVERSDKFQASVETPVLGMFANGSNVVASGVVSAKYAAGTEEEMTLVSLTINGVTATLGTLDEEGNVAWSTSEPINLVNGQPNREAISMMATLCWSDGTNTVCRTMPWGLLEGYEIVGLRQSGGSVGLFFDGSGMWPCTNQYQVVPLGGEKHVYEFSLSSTNSGIGREAWESVMGIQEECVAQVTEPTGFHFLTQATYGVCTNSSEYQAYPAMLFSDPWCWYWEATMAQPMDENGDYIRGLSMGYSHDDYPGEVMAFMMEGREEGGMTFRAPSHYASNTVVLLTLEGMRVNSETTTDVLAQVKLAWAGSAPTHPVAVVTNAVGGYDVSYLVAVDGAKEYTLSGGNFDWPTNIVADASATHTNHWLSFSGFHNGLCKPIETIHGAGWDAVWNKIKGANCPCENAKIETLFYRKKTTFKTMLEGLAPIMANNKQQRDVALINGGFFDMIDGDNPLKDFKDSSIAGYVGLQGTWVGNPINYFWRNGDILRWCFGVDQINGYVIEPEKVVRTSTGKNQYFPGDTVKWMPFGMSNVGFLFKDGVAKDKDSEWPDGETGRSVIVWSLDKKNVFFVYIEKETWKKTQDILTGSFTQKMQGILGKDNFAIGDAIMLDGGGSVRLGVRSVPPGASAEHEFTKILTSGGMRFVPTFVYSHAENDLKKQN